MKLSLILLLLLIFSVLTPSLANNIKTGTQRIKKIVSEQGFFQNTVNNITSDSYGFLWVATPNGLVKYNGYTF